MRRDGMVDTSGDVVVKVKVASRSVSRFHRLGGGEIDLAVLHRVLVPQLLREKSLDEFALSFREKTCYEAED